jgi:hypothetical protein
MASTDSAPFAAAVCRSEPAGVAETSPLFAWPGRRLLAYAAALAAVQMVWFAFVYGGADRITAQRSMRLTIHLEIERQMPFVPATIVLYMSIYLLFAAAPLVLRSRRELNQLSLTLASVILVAGFCFLAFPANLAYDAERNWGVWAGWFAVADRMNLRYNAVPSLHVALSIVCVDIYAARAGIIGRTGFWLWGAGIAFSTLLTHEHHLLDVITGSALALAATRMRMGRRLRGTGHDRAAADPSCEFAAPTGP